MSTTPEPPQIANAEQLLLTLLGKLLVVEETLARTVLPRLKEEIEDAQLQEVISHHLDETRSHVDNVRAAFAAMPSTASGEEAAGLEGLKQEREHVLQQLAPALRDGFNASAAMGTEHYEIATYEAAIRLADALSLAEVEGLLRSNHEDEVTALHTLADHATRLAQQAAKQPAVA